MKKIMLYIAVFAISFAFAETSEGVFDKLKTNKKVFYIPQFSDFEEISTDDMLSKPSISRYYR